MQGSKGLMPILILLVFSLVSIKFDCFFPSKDEVGVQPKLSIFAGEKIVSATWIENNGIRYGVWDVRKENDNNLMFTIVCTPADGTLIKNPEISARVLAIRLTLQMAKVVQMVTEQSQNVGQIVGTIGNILNTTASTAKFCGQTKVARELDALKYSFSQKADMAVAIANIVASSKEAAETLIQERSDEKAEHFLVTIATTGITHGSVPLAMPLMIRALGLMKISTTEWIDAFYGKITDDQMPLLEGLALTYGRHETSRTFQQIAERVSGA